MVFLSVRRFQVQGVQRDATVDDIAAALHGVLARHFGVVGPQPLAAARVDGMHHAPRGGDVHDAVHHQRRGFDAAGRFEVVGPRKAQLAHVAGVDLGELAVAGFGVVEAVGRPVGGAGGVAAHGAFIDVAGDGRDVFGRALGRRREGGLT